MYIFNSLSYTYPYTYPYKLALTQQIQGIITSKISDSIAFSQAYILYMSVLIMKLFVLN